MVSRVHLFNQINLLWKNHSNRNVVIHHQQIDKTCAIMQRLTVFVNHRSFINLNNHFGDKPSSPILNKPSYNNKLQGIENILN
jgi:hypothetical protein